MAFIYIWPDFKGLNFCSQVFCRIHRDREEKEKRSHEMGIGGEMDEEDSLALMIDLGATWNMMRKLRR